MVLQIESEAQFRQLLKSAGDKPIIVDFFAEWCGPCKKIAPFFEELSKQFTSALFYKANIDDLQFLADDYEIEKLPTFICFQNGKPVGKMESASVNALSQFVSSFCKVKSLTLKDFLMMSTQKAQFLKFSSPTCKPCAMIQPLFKEMANKYKGGEFHHIDITTDSTVAEELKIEALPTFVCLKNGKIVGVVEGAIPKDLVNLVETNC